MLYLLLVILLNTFIFIAFKLFAKYHINALQAITINYWVCTITGLLVHGYVDCTPCILNENWLYSALYMGAFFILLFNLMSYGTAKQGMTVTTIANKLSLVIPVIFSWWLYNESMGWMKIAGIALAIPAVYLATAKEGKVEVKNLFLPVLIFICSGISDTAIKYIQQHQLYNQDIQSAFTITMFAVAALLGTVIVIIRLLAGKDSFAMKNVIAGILLGIPNYFSIYYLIRLFDKEILPGSSIIPVNNIGIVLSTTLVAIFLFKEQAGSKRIVGIILSIVSIILIALSGN